MLERLSFKNLGPSAAMSLDFGDRLNILTGDNGLGKTFILDAAWWALTRTWADGKQLEPPVRATKTPELSYSIHGGVKGPREISCKYDLKVGKWRIKQGRPPIPGLVVYARVDGGFSVWDPARNYWKEKDASPEEDRERPSSFQFTRRQVWSGLWRTEESEKKRLSDDLLCRGLVEDLVTWWQQKGAEWQLFENILAALSSDKNCPLTMGEPVSAVRGLVKVPTLKVPYSKEPIRVTESSAGVRRILSLAYILVWAWLTHKEEVEAFPKRATKAQRLILLFDEIETHLHPEWQRRLLPGLLAALESSLLKDAGVHVQIIGTTHAPLVLASLEPFFNESTDRFFTIEPDKQRGVKIEEREWALQGDALNWLVSEAFGLKQGRSVEGQIAVEAAEAWMRGDKAALPAGLKTAPAIDQELRKLLADNDSFKLRWSYAREVQNK